MNYFRMESVDPERNRFRYYLTFLQPTLWSQTPALRAGASVPDRVNTWALVCRWGRIGEEPRGIQVNECATRDEALQRAAEVIEMRMRHGYVVK